MKNYKIYDINKIEFIKKTNSKKGSLIYWVKVECQFKRIPKVYFSILKKKGIKIVSATKTRCLAINKNNLQCKRITTNKYCFQHEKKKFTFIDLFSGGGDFSLGLKKAGLKHSATKTRCLAINKNNLQCKRITTNRYCFQHEKKKKFTFIDLFSGGGGFSLGLKKAGLKHIYGVDSWKPACETYTKNIGFNICEDLNLLQPVELNINIDILVGSPPCKPFSLANRRKTNNSEENLLYLCFIKYLKYYKPKVFVLENVIGLLSYKTKNGLKFIDSMIKDLSEFYHVKIIKVCCSNFGVPQKRKRVFITGVKKIFGLFFPDLKKYPCNKFLRHFLLPKEKVSKNYFLSTKAISGILRRKNINLTKGNGFGAKYLDKDSFCNTITANYWKDGYSSLIKYNDKEIRRLTECEIKSIQSFPKNFNFYGTKKERYTQIGNAVPPQMAYFLGKQIITFLNNLF